MKQFVYFIGLLLLIVSCNSDDNEYVVIDNPELILDYPNYFPSLNKAYYSNQPTKYGVELGEKLFHDVRLSTDNTISCASCHIKEFAFADNHAQAIGIKNRVGMRNTPSIQNLAFINQYNWDGNKFTLESQSLVPIITHEEMNSSILEVIQKIKGDEEYKALFKKAFGDENIMGERIYKSIAQYEYTLISANSKYDRVLQNTGEVFTAPEGRGYTIFQQKCASCHSTALFTDQSFRNIGFPINPNPDEAGRARVTGEEADLLKFRVPSLRNVEYTAPYGSFGQFATLRDVLDYLDKGVIDSKNLDPILKQNKNRIPLTELEKEDLISFMKTLSDPSFIEK